jgi:hypothetical protein
MSNIPEFVVLSIGALARHRLCQRRKACVAHVDRTFNKLGKRSKNLRFVYHQMFFFVEQYLMHLLIFFSIWV